MAATAFGRLRQEDHKLEVLSSYILRPVSKQPTSHNPPPQQNKIKMSSVG
jgi:hypothetical protein